MTYLAFVALMLIPLRWLYINRSLLVMSLRCALYAYSGHEEGVRKVDQFLLIVFIIGMGALTAFSM